MDREADIGGRTEWNRDQKAMHVRIVQFDRYELLMIIKTRIDVK